MSLTTSRNAKEQRRDNAYQILNIIRTSHEDVSRKRLKDLTGLSFPSVNSIVNYLLDFRLIQMFEGAGASRKKVPCYRFNETDYAVFGAALFPKRAFAVCTDLKGRVLNQFEVPYAQDWDSFISRLAEGFGSIRGKLGNRRVLALGAGCPGLIDHRRRTVVYSNKFPELEQQDFLGILEQKLGIPAFMDHNPNLSAFAARRIGCARDLNSFLYVLLDKGIGGALIEGNRIFRGDSSFIGELGHSVIHTDGPVCSCGNRGCLEVYAAENVIHTAMEEKSPQEQESFLKETAEKIGLTMGSLICFLGIRNVVFGGRTLAQYPELFYQIRHVLLSRTLPVYQPELEIRLSNLDQLAVPRGAALMAGEMALSNLSAAFFGDPAPVLPLRTDRVMQKS